MKEIRDFTIEYIPVQAQIECLHELYEATDKCEFVKTEMPRAWNPFRDAYQEMARIYRIPIGSALTTDKILKLDSQRDQTGYAIDVAIEAALKSIDPEMVAAAEQLAQTKVSFPIDTKKGYLYQTSQVETYVDVMLGAQLENTTKVGVLALVQNLKAVNDMIHELIAERGQDRVEKQNEPSRPVARTAAIDTWHTLVKYINGYNLVILGATGPVAQLDLCIDTDNEICSRYRSIYIGGSSNKPAESEQPTEGGNGGNTENKPGETEKPNETPNEGGNNGENGGNENTGGTPPEQENPNQPPPPTGGGESGFDW